MKRVVTAGLMAMVAMPALAGPPYVTDDPVPTELHHWEIYAFTAATRLGHSHEGAIGVDLNYGAIYGVQLTATLPLAFGTATRLRLADVELGAKVRILNDAASHLAVAVFPRIILPTARGRSEPGKVALLLPIWGQHDFGPWSLFGGGGYTFNPGSGNRDFARAGLALTRTVSDRVAFGGEVTWRGVDTVGGRSYAALIFGGSVKIGGPLTVIVSAGPGLSHRDDGGRFNGYVALLANF